MAVSRISKDMAALMERDPGLLCAYCMSPLALPFPQVPSDRWEATGWELRLLPDGEPVWELAEGRILAHREHVHPASKGGSDHIDNLVLACEVCNSAKRATSLLLFLARRAGLPRFRSVGGPHIELFARAWAA